MKIPVTVWKITCNNCEEDFPAPRAQDYWTDLEDLDWRLEANDWASPADDVHYCPACLETLTTPPGFR